MSINGLIMISVKTPNNNIHCITSSIDNAIIIFGKIVLVTISKENNYWMLHNVIILLLNNKGELIVYLVQENKEKGVTYSLWPSSPNIVSSSELKQTKNSFVYFVHAFSKLGHI